MIPRMGTPTLPVWSVIFSLQLPVFSMHFDTHCQSIYVHKYDSLNRILRVGNASVLQVLKVMVSKAA